MRRPAPRGSDLLPGADPFVLRVLMGLAALVVGVTILRSLNVPVDRLAWWSFDSVGRSGAFGWWQPLSSLLIHAPGSSGLTSVFIDSVLLYLIVPSVRNEIEDSVTVRALLAGVLGGIVVGLGANALGLGFGARFGWGSVLWSLFLLLGLKGPERTFLLFWVLPVSGRAIVWGSLALSALFCVSEASLGNFAGLGTWLGTAGYWYGLGPGGRRRQLKAKAGTIERELRSLRVIQGGRNSDDDVN